MSRSSHPMHTRPPMVIGGADTDPAALHYRVFVSYSHADTKWATWLMRRLESYRVPARFHGRAAPLGKVGPRIAPVFRDRDELPTTNDLGETIRAALRASATLVVVCSPASAKSRWVQEEIVAFKRLHGEALVFAFIVAGEPKAEGMAEDCFSPALRRGLGPDGVLSSTPAEVVAADARPHADGREDAFTRLVAGLLGVGFDELRQREQQRRHRRMTLIATGSVLGMAITLGLAALAWQARNDARRRQEQGEDLLAFMLGDLRGQLEKVGRLDVLESVGDKSMAYFAELKPRDLTDTALARQAKALTQIGQVRMAQERFPEAARAFFTAFERAAALAARHPRNREMLFERAQAEYWIGFVHWNRGDLPPATEWMKRYHESATALLALDPSDLSGRREFISSQHNLSAFHLDQNRFDLARAGFQAELAMLTEMIAAAPQDAQLRFSAADVVSYLGTLAERSGDYAEALRQFQEHTRRCEAIVRDNPQNPRWQERLANAFGFEATVLEITGHRAAALARRRQARELAAAVAQRDPANRTWRRAALGPVLKEAVLVRALGDEASARALASEARAGYEALHKAEPTNRVVAGSLMAACRLDAQLSTAAGRPDGAEAVARAIAIGEGLIAKVRANDTQLGEFLHACVVAGQIAGSRGDQAAALRHWQRAVEVARPRLAGSSNWRLLDPAARVFALLGRMEESRVLTGRLQHAGYQPVDPWPATGGPATPVGTPAQKEE